MGIEIQKTTFEAHDYERFEARLQQNLEVLENLLQQPQFGKGKASLGAELELYIVDQKGHPLYINQEILKESNNPQLTLELNQYNLEYNLTPYYLDEQPFLATEREMQQQLESLANIARSYDARIVPIGILPTLQKSDIGLHSITDRQRYHAFVKQLRERRGCQFQIDIDGKEPLKCNVEDITLEGVNTSFQVHYRVDPEHYTNIYNAIQLVTPLVLAIGANSPTLFGHSLWHETRIPLFKQSIDTRTADNQTRQQRARVCFGSCWLQDGVMELFQDAVETYSPLLPVCHELDPYQEIQQGLTPSLAELCLHQGAIWLWNRPVYDNSDGGQLRIEMRALPSGPTSVDMVANAAFLIGMAEGIKTQMPEWQKVLPFRLAKFNFYRAAQFGLDAELLWPDGDTTQKRSILELIEEFIPIAAQGLRSIGISKQESQKYLSVIKQRAQQRQSGAVWQQQMLHHLEQHYESHDAHHQLLERFIKHSQTNTPVAEWSLDI